MSQVVLSFITIRKNNSVHRVKSPIFWGGTSPLKLPTEMALQHRIIDHQRCIRGLQKRAGVAKKKTFCLQKKVKNQLFDEKIHFWNWVKNELLQRGKVHFWARMLRIHQQLYVPSLTIELASTPCKQVFPSPQQVPRAHTQLSSCDVKWSKPCWNSAYFAHSVLMIMIGPIPFFPQPIVIPAWLKRTRNT